MLAPLVAAVNLFAQAFAGTWICHGSMTGPAGRPAHAFTSTWSIRTAPGGNWAVVRWGPQSDARGGIAYVGFIPAEKDWAYQDFHYDGSYGVSTSAGPDRSGTWTWAGGGYYTSAGILHGSVAWKPVSPSRIDRTYFTLNGRKLERAGSDSCIKQ